MPYNYSKWSQSLPSLSSQQRVTTMIQSSQFITPKDKPYFDERNLDLIRSATAGIGTMDTMASMVILGYTAVMDQVLNVVKGSRLS